MKFVQAKHYRRTDGRSIRLQVIHDMEAPEKDTTAEAVANYFARGTVKASAHYCFDNDSEVQCVHDKDVAYAAPGANHDGLQYELAGYAKQTADEWRDKFSLATLSRCAVVVSKRCEQYAISKTWLTDAEIRMGKSGICDHWAISRVYRKSTHTDTGANFPKDLFVDLVRASPLLTQNPTPSGGTTIMNDAQAFLICPVDGGEQKLQADGGIFNANGCGHYHGSYLEPNMAEHRNVPRTFRDIQRVGQTGYRILAHDGATYEFNG